MEAEENVPRPAVVAVGAVAPAPRLTRSLIPLVDVRSASVLAALATEHLLLLVLLLLLIVSVSVAAAMLAGRYALRLTPRRPVKTM